MKMKIVINKSGVSIIAVILLSAAVLGAGVFLTKYISSNKSRTKDLKRTIEERMFFGQIRYLMSRPSILEKTFGDYDQSDLGALYDCTSPGSTDLVIKDSGNEEVFKTGTKFGNVEIENIQLDTSNCSNDDIDSWPDIPNDIYTVRRISLQLSVVLKKDLGNSLLRSKDQDDISISLYIGKDDATNVYKLLDIKTIDTSPNIVSESESYCKQIGGEYRQDKDICLFTNLDYSEDVCKNLFNKLNVQNQNVSSSMLGQNRTSSLEYLKYICTQKAKVASPKSSELNTVQMPFFSKYSNQNVICSLEKKGIAAAGNRLTQFCTYPIFGGCVRPKTYSGNNFFDEVWPKGMERENGHTYSGGKLDLDITALRTLGLNGFFSGGISGVALNVVNIFTLGISNIIFQSLWSCKGKTTYMATVCDGMGQTYEDNYATMKKKRKGFSCKRRWTFWGSAHHRVIPQASHVPNDLDNNYPN